MGVCCGLPKKKLTGPKVALIGATGFVGQFITPQFLEALKEGKLLELRIISSKSSDITSIYADKGAKVSIVEYSKVDTVVSALQGVDVVVSTLGNGGADLPEVKQAILEALEVANVKIYFPSEFGANHYHRCEKYVHPGFEAKKEHFQAAQDKGIKAIGIICFPIMEMAFSPLLGLDSQKEVWTLVGNGEVPVAMSAKNDIARFTLEAVLKSFADPINFPELIEIHSDLKTMKEYAADFDAVAGRPTKLEFTPIDQALAKYEKSNMDFFYLLQILMGEGGFDCSDGKWDGNELLNPEQNVWKLKTVQDFAEETKGRPVS